MTRNDFPAVPPANFKRGLLIVMMLAGLAGCDTLKTITEPERIDYKSASKVESRRLEIPPNLTQLQRDNRYAIPGDSRGTVTASGFNMQQGARPTTTATNIAPAAISDMHIERAGDQRWLVVKQSPDALWPLIKDFWQDSGFLINVEMPDAGIMETDWAENRLKVPQGFLRNSLGKMLDSVYDTGERDKFRTRLERGANGYTEIYISHRGAQEVLTGGAGVSGKESTVWTSRPSDPELEAQFLSLLMTRLGAEDVKAKTAVANALPMQARARLVKGSDGSHVETDEGFDRAWRRVGLALDRVGFTVEDRDRAQGLYFVRYVDQDDEAKNKAASEKGFISRLFSWGSSDKPKTAQRYRVSVKEVGSRSQVVVLNNDGRVDNSPTANKILTLLSEQLK
ncbi:MAG: outer membrane protein assembly factor BamC [Proteobacteria bacterium]|nr:outer membrane protein assembly factor BamC [Pseudomonadota bacterium]